ncbi:MAG TPA: zf-HC2 domain-containing protein [Actinomycetota bacterium]|jgi:hypothetical protein
MSDILRPDDSAHPDEALAGFVDGTLTAAERADVQAHLDGCERCRAQVAQATAAADALRSLPELDAPWGLGRAAVEEARKQSGRSAHPERRRRVAWVAGAAAAVVLVAGLSVAVLRNPGGENAATAPVTTGTTSVPHPAAGGVKENGFVTNKAFIQRSSVNFSSEDVSRLAKDASADVRHGTTRSPFAPTGTTGATSGSSSGGTSAPVTSGRTVNANEVGPVACLDTAAEYASVIRPIHIIDARYEEKPALIGIFLQGSSPTRGADLVVVWVASKDDCQVLSYASSSVSP